MRAVFTGAKINRGIGGLDILASIPMGIFCEPRYSSRHQIIIKGRYKRSIGYSAPRKR